VGLAVAALCARAEGTPNGAPEPEKAADAKTHSQKRDWIMGNGVLKVELWKWSFALRDFEKRVRVRCKILPKRI
jgi:hypothetical protein